MDCARQKCGNTLSIYLPWQWAPITTCSYWSTLRSVHQLPILTGWIKAAWKTKFVRHFYIWPALEMKTQIFWCWAQRPIHLTMCSYTRQLESKLTKGVCLESRYPRDYTYSSDFTFPLILDAYGCLQLSIQSWICAPGTNYGCVDRGSVVYEVLPDTSTHGQHCESDHRPSDLESNALSTWPHAPI